MSHRWRAILVVLAASTSLLGACSSGSTPKRDGGDDAAGGSGGATLDAGDTADLVTDDAIDSAATDDSSSTDDSRSTDDASSDSGADAPSLASNCGVAGSLLVDCGFELPVVTSGYLSFSVGQSFGGWMVVGVVGGSVSPLSGVFQQNGFSFTAHEGAQTLDLTGFDSNSATGVSQAVPTTPGARYDLSFWVGNIVNPGGIFGTTSQVLVFVDGNQILSAENDDGAGTTTLVWKGFSTSFIAAGASTTVEFRNADPATDNSNILDDITLLKE